MYFQLRVPPMLCSNEGIIGADADVSARIVYKTSPLVRCLDLIRNVKITDEAFTDISDCLLIVA